MIKVPFSWPGNKTAHLDHVLKHIPRNTTRFVDVFGGSGAVLFNTPFHELDVFNDINSHVVNFYRVLKDSEEKEKLIHYLEISVHSREEFDHCMSNKDIVEDKALKAYMWYYTVQTSFARLGRHYGRNMNNSFETKRVYEKIPCFEDIHQRIRHCYIENKNAFEIMEEYDRSNTVFYLDPPYINTPVGTYKHKFTIEDHKKLLETIFSLKGMVVLSGEPHDLYDSYTWSHSEKWGASVKINNGERERGRTECLWVKR